MQKSLQWSKLALYAWFNHRANLLSIIAITGLAGHALGSWKAPGSYAVWLRDFLPKDIPDCRILTYGYYAAVQSGDSKNTIQDYGKQFLEAVHTVRECEVCTRVIILTSTHDY